MLKAVSIIKNLCSKPTVGLNSVKDVQNLLSTSELSGIVTPCRTTFILKRKHPVKLIKKHVDQTTYVPIKRRNKVYELETYTESEPERSMNVILNEYVAGVGDKGDVVSLKRSQAYNKLLLPGLATYATPEAVKKAEEKAKQGAADGEEKRYSSVDAHRTVNVLTRLIVSVTMNQENEWILEPWHIRTSFRKSGVHIMSDDCIVMPKHPIKGPDLNLENKEFLVTIIINNKERVPVRCRLHHWHPDVMIRAPPVSLHWTKPAEPMFQEEAEILSKMPLPPVPKLKEDQLS